MNSMEEKIINATVSCIEKYGIKKTTIRQIGKEAGVNSASISYYFRSKDILIDRVMKVALYNAFDFENFAGTRGLPIKERLAVIMEGMIAGALKFPNITRAFFAELFNSNHYDLPVVESCNAFVTRLEREINESLPDIPKCDVRILLMQMTSSTFLFLGLFPGFYSGFPEIDLADESIRKDYVQKLIDKLL